MSNRRKKAIRERVARTGESYSTARMNLLEQGYGSGSVGGNTSRVRRLVEEIINLAPMPARSKAGGIELFPVVWLSDLPRDPEADLRRDPLYQHLRGLDDEDLRKVEVLLYAGRERGVDVLELAGDLGRDLPRATAEHLVEKSSVLGEYLRAGLEAADEQGVALDAPWPTPEGWFPLGRWFRVRGFEVTHERDPDQPAAVVTGVLLPEGIEFRLDGVLVGRLHAEDGGRDRAGRWIALRAGDERLDTGVLVSIRPAADEMRREIDGMEIDLDLGGADDYGRHRELSIYLDRDGRWRGGGLPAGRVRFEELHRFEA